MAIEILPLVEADLAEYARIHFSAFAGGISAFLGDEFASGGFLESERKAMKEDSTAFYLKAVDRDDGRMLACAKYHKYPIMSEDEFKRLHPVRPAPASAHPVAWKDFFSRLQEAKVKYLTRKECWYLSILITDPPHYRRGAGGQLIAWGCEHADKDKLPLHLESSSIGYPLYLRHGFETLEHFDLDLTKYGGSGKSGATAMFRQPRAQAEVVET